MANKIYVNSNVINSYRSGMSLNDAIVDVYGNVIQEKISENKAFAEMTPLQIVMHDARINKYSKVGDIMDLAYTSGGTDTNEWLFPAWVETTLREAIYAQDIINFVVDTTIGVDSNVVKSATLDLKSEENKKAIKRARIAEGADLPTAVIRIGQKAITLWKHGRAIELTYEAARRMRIDLFTKHMSAIINDLAFQNLEEAVDVLKNGDGNNNGAEVLGTTANAGVITPTELSNFLIDYWFKNHFAADTIIANKDMFKQINGFFYDKQLSSGASAKLKFNTPQLGVEQNVNLLAVEGDENEIILSNRANSLIRYVENGSNIQENQNFARNQTRLLTMSENSGYAVGVAGSASLIKIKK